MEELCACPAQIYRCSSLQVQSHLDLNFPIGLQALGQMHIRKNWFLVLGTFFKNPLWTPLSSVQDSENRARTNPSLNEIHGGSYQKLKFSSHLVTAF